MTDWVMNIARPSQAWYSRTKPVSVKHVTAGALEVSADGKSEGARPGGPVQRT